MYLAKDVTLNAVTQKVFDDSIVHGILIGGDQLTRKRIERAKELAKNGISPDMELKGLIPICHDWHTKKAICWSCVDCLSTDSLGTIL